MTVPNLSNSENTPCPVLDPNDDVFYNDRCEVYLREGKVDKAIEDYSRSIKHAP